MHRESRTVTRQELYEQVWTTPMTHLAKEYGISGSTLARICKRHRIPTPGSGYWMSKQHGKAPRRPPLPAAEDPELNTVNFSEWTPPKKEKQVKVEGFDSEIVALLKKELTAKPIKVPNALRDPHPYLAAAMKEYQRLRRRSPALGTYEFSQHRVKTLVDVHVQSESTMQRAFRLMDTLIKALEKRGFKVERPAYGTKVTVCGETFDIRLYEPSLQKPHQKTPEEKADERARRYSFAPKLDHVPSGQLCLRLCVPTDVTRVIAQWRDTKTRSVEDRLNDFIRRLLREADDDKRQRAEVERRHQEQLEAERLRQEELELRRQEQEARLEEQKRVNDLLAEVRAWRQSQEIQAYLAEIRRVHAAQGKAIEPDSELGQWMEWAEGVNQRLADKVFKRF